MFITADQHEDAVHAAVGRRGFHHWTVVQLELRMPWFLPTWVEGLEDGFPMPSSAFLIFENDLLELLKQQPAGLKCLQYVLPKEEGNVGWHMKEVERLWQAPSPDLENEPVVMVEDDEGRLFTHLGCEVPGGDRTLLWTRPN